MDILTFNNICCFHGEITLGRWENDPSTDTYKIVNDVGTFYAVANFTKVSNVTLPDDYEDDKYLYEDGKYTKNPDFTKHEIEELKKYLDSTDYIYIKCMETGEDVEVVYADIVAQRKIVRAKIQELES